MIAFFFSPNASDSNRFDEEITCIEYTIKT